MLEPCVCALAASAQIVSLTAFAGLALIAFVLVFVVSLPAYALDVSLSVQLLVLAHYCAYVTFGLVCDLTTFSGSFYWHAVVATALHVHKDGLYSHLK